MVRDQFTIFTWLLLGALIQSAAFAWLPYRNIVLVLPVLLILGFKATSTLLKLTGIIENEYMKNVIPSRTTAVFPNEKGGEEKAGGSTVCAILLAVVSNHPLGMLAPGYKEIGDRFDNMVDELSADATKLGFLGASKWLNAAERTTSSEFMTILYFVDDKALHAFAHGPTHSDATRW